MELCRYPWNGPLRMLPRRDIGGIATARGHRCPAIGRSRAWGQNEARSAKRSTHRDRPPHAAGRAPRGARRAWQAGRAEDAAAGERRAVGAIRRWTRRRDVPSSHPPAPRGGAHTSDNPTIARVEKRARRRVVHLASGAGSLPDRHDRAQRPRWCCHGSTAHVARCRHEARNAIWLP